MGWSCEKMGDEKLAKRADAQKVEGNEGEEDRNCDGVYIKWPRKSGRRMKKMTDRRNWRLLTGNVVGEIWEGKKTMEKDIMVNWRHRCQENNNKKSNLTLV